MVGAIFELSDEKFGIVARLIVVRQSRCMQDTAFAAADDLVKSSRQRVAAWLGLGRESAQSTLTIVADIGRQRSISTGMSAGQLPRQVRSSSMFLGVYRGIVVSSICYPGACAIARVSLQCSHAIGRASFALEFLECQEVQRIGSAHPALCQFDDFLCDGPCGGIIDIEPSGCGSICRRK